MILRKDERGCVVVNGVTHRVVGTAKERPGVKDGEALKKWLHDAFMEGARKSIPHPGR